jgi:hypothetical protein
VALWLFAGCWSSKNLQDGFVPDDVVPSFGFHAEAPNELIRVGLWKQAEKDGETGYQFHDWADYQPSADRVAEKRRAGIERKARSRARLSAAKKASNEPVIQELARGIANDSHASRMPRDGLAPASPAPRASLADASRVTGSGFSSENSSLSTETISSTETSHKWASREADNSAVGYRWLDDALGGGGRAISLQDWRKDYHRIGSKPAAERALVARHMKLTKYIAENLRKAKPDHLLRYWDDFVAGPRNFDVKSVAPARKRGPAPVSTPEQFELDNQFLATGGDPWA